LLPPCECLSDQRGINQPPWLIGRSIASFDGRVRAACPTWFPPSGWSGLEEPRSPSGALHSLWGNELHTAALFLSWPKTRPTVQGLAKPCLVFAPGAGLFLLNADRRALLPAPLELLQCSRVGCAWTARPPSGAGPEYSPVLSEPGRGFRFMAELACRRRRRRRAGRRLSFRASREASLPRNGLGAATGRWSAALSCPPSVSRGRPHARECYCM
jgi:hypothetical protein